MSSRRYLSPPSVAAALGVGATTVKRWVDEGVLPAQRTVGGHRRILLRDVLRLARAGHFPRLDLGRLGLPQRGEAPPDSGEVAGQLRDALTGGDGARSRL